MKKVVSFSISILVFWITLIFVLCATPGQYIPSASWLELLSVDKLIHASIFFILTALFFINVIRFNLPFVFLVLALVLSVIYGISLEWMQARFFINRSADWLDIIANSVGAILTFFFLPSIQRFVAKWK